VESTACRGASDIPLSITYSFIKRLGKDLSGEVKGFCRVVTKRPKVQGHEKWGVKCSEVQWGEVK
jgi:hypothetical protein